nr:MAG TPA: hypothetical protein [Caudoviricetes sp.]
MRIQRRGWPAPRRPVRRQRPDCPIPARRESSAQSRRRIWRGAALGCRWTRRRGSCR